MSSALKASDFTYGEGWRRLGPGVQESVSFVIAELFLVSDSV